MHVLKRNSTNFDCCFWDFNFVLVLANQSENGTSFSILNEIGLRNMTSNVSYLLLEDLLALLHFLFVA